MLTTDALLFAFLLFSLRVINYAVSTIRLVMISRGRKVIAASMAFLEALIFAVVMAKVVSDLQNIPNLLAYCAGAAVGSYIGMWLEARIIISYATATIIARDFGTEIADALRLGGYGATITRGEGREGEVVLIRSTALSREVPHMMEIIREVNPDAFIEVEAARTLKRGWLPGGPPSRA